MPVSFRKTEGKFPLEELIEQCNKAVETVEETVISVGKTFETSNTEAIKAVVQSPLAILERNIEKLREVQNVVEEILKIKDEPLCGTKFTKRQVTDATFRCVDYLAAFVAVALIIMETSDTAAKYLGETDVPKGFTAALVMVSKVLSAMMDHRRKQELERQKFLTMLKDVEIKCRKIEEFAAIYNVFRSISALRSEGSVAFDQKSNCKEAVKVLKSMPGAKLSSDLEKNLKRQLSTAIMDGAKELMQERFRAIFDRNQPINVKRRLFDRWYNAYVVSNRMSKIYKSNRFMLLESKEKMKFVFKQWAGICLKRKRVLERSRELLTGTCAADKPHHGYEINHSLQKFAAENPPRKNSFAKVSPFVTGAGVFSSDESKVVRQSIDSQSLGSEGEGHDHSSGDERESITHFNSHRSQQSAEVYVRRARNQRGIHSISGYRSCSSESSKSQSCQETGFSARGDAQFPSLGLAHSSNTRYAQIPHSFSGYVASPPLVDDRVMREEGNKTYGYGYESRRLFRRDPELDPVPSEMAQMEEAFVNYHPSTFSSMGMAPFYEEANQQKEANLSIYSSSRRSSHSSVDRELAVLGSQKETIQQGNFMIESSFMYKPKEEALRGIGSSSVEPMRLNLPLAPSISSTPTGQSSGFVVVQMPEIAEKSIEGERRA